MSSGDDPLQKSQEFAQMFQKAKEFTEELLKENERLRFKLAGLAGAPADERARELSGRVRELEAQLLEVEKRYKEVEQENKEFADRYVEIEEQNNNLANLYVASYQLHSTLDFKEAVRIVEEILINLIGARTFAILLLDEKTNDLQTVASEGDDAMPGIDKISVRLGEGVLGTV